MKNPDFGGLITAGSEIQSDYYIHSVEEIERSEMEIHGI
jgi:hypothetical protein